MPSDPGADPRVDLILAREPVLASTGRGTIEAVLRAADAAGIIPPSRTEHLYGIDFRPQGGDIYRTATLAGAHDINESGSGGEGSFHGTVVSATHTTYKPTHSGWVPAPKEDDDA
jgi:hypothetical protein